VLYIDYVSRVCKLALERKTAETPKLDQGRPWTFTTTFRHNATDLTFYFPASAKLGSQYRPAGKMALSQKRKTQSIGISQDRQIMETEDGFRKFMKTLNKLGGGELFEAMPPEDVDSFIKDCAHRARATATLTP
jgi:hypothetical protein